MRVLANTLLSVALWLTSPSCLAHSFGRVYNLPIPVWLYLFGAAAALAASFLVIAYFSTRTGRELTLGTGFWSGRLIVPVWVLWALRGFGLSGLLLCSLTGLLGIKSPYGNFNMTFFWVIFVLGFTYLTAVIGNLYEWINPWKLITDGICRIGNGFDRGRLTYPKKLGHWPATVLYMAFIWYELFGDNSPYSLSILLIIYSVLNLLGVWLIGAFAWFRYCEFFSVFFRLIGLMAPVRYESMTTAHRPVVVLRRPFSGVPDFKVTDTGILLFIVFMLSSTAFDGIHETVFWQRLYWVHFYNAALEPVLGPDKLKWFEELNQAGIYWQSLWLIASALIYYSVYVLFISLGKWAARSKRSVRPLTREFAATLLPIALVYNMTHYYTLIQSQGVKIIALISDPFGWGWNLFGTARWFQYNIIPDVESVWHIQVVLIVFGHIVSVYLAHCVALKVFDSQRAAVLSQIPTLFLMMCFTSAGLWILSQPIQGGI